MADDNPGTYAVMRTKSDADDSEQSDEPAQFSKQQYVRDSASAPAFQYQAAYPSPYPDVQPQQYPPGYPPPQQYPPGYPPPQQYPPGYPPAMDHTSIPMYQSPGYENDASYATMPEYPAQRLIVPIPVEDDPSCALCGLLLSWIPIIGWITCFMNLNARAGSRRRAFGRFAGAIATTVFCFSLYFGIQG